MTTGLYIGRFQPFHNGHLWAIKRILEEVDDLIIVIGSSQDVIDDDNFLTTDQRKDMILRVCEQERIDSNRIRLIPIPDYEKCSDWQSAIRREAGEVDKVYSGNKVVQSLFKDVYDIEEYSPFRLHATELRKMMKKGAEWKEYVPDAVIEYMEGFSQ